MRKKSIRWLFGRVKKHTPLLVVLTVLSVLQAFSAVAIAVFSKRVIDIATGAREGGSRAFLFACLILAGIVLVLILLRFLIVHLRETLSISLDRDWKKDLLGRLLTGRFSEVSAYHSGELVNRLSADVKAVDDGIVQVIPTFAAMIARFASATAALFVLSPKLTVILLGAGVFVLLVTTAFRRFLKELHKKVSAANGKANSLIQEALEKLLMIQAMDVAGEMTERGENVFNERAKIQKKQRNFLILGMSGLSLIMSILYYGSLIFMAAELLRGEGGVTVGTLTAVTQLVGQMQNPITNVSSVIQAYIAMQGSAERLMELYEIPLDPAAETLPDGIGKEDISAKALSFAYPGDEEPVFTDLSFRIPAGQFTAVVGESGIGKSTILKLLLGIYEPSGGSLEAGNVPLTRKTRRLFSYVPQGNLLLSGTLRDNLTLISPAATEEEIEKAVEAADLKDFVESLPEGLDTVLGESGAGISEGQAERIAIARALLRDAPVLLFDEATSSLDPETEKRVLDRVKKIPGKTVVAVTHRPYAREIADHVVEIRKGTSEES